jgi:hypothetical protein
MGTGAEQYPAEPGCDTSNPSADEEEELAAAAEAAQDRGFSPTPGAICRHSKPGVSTRRTGLPTTEGTEEAREADAFIASILGDIKVNRIERFPPPPSPTQFGGEQSALDSWEMYMDTPVY